VTLAACAIAIAVSTLILWWGSVELDTAADRLASHLEMPPAVQGALLAAIGSSFPELSTAVLSTWAHGAFELGMSAIVGSAVFNVLAIPALSCLLGDRLRVDLSVLYKDGQFYLTAIATLLLTFAFARIYHPLDPGLSGEISRPIALIPLALYCLYLFMQHRDREDHRVAAQTPPVPLLRPSREWGRLALGLAAILAGVEGLVRSALWLGERLDVPSFVWGATMIAAATSLPDALISIRSAGRGDSDVSLANVFGSNSFDLLVAVPAGVLVAGTAVVSLDVAVPLMAFLAFATIFLFALVRVGLTLGRGEAVVLLLLYLGFVAAIAVVRPSGAAG
jgi:cation:H+ antiporter